jgi:DNA/RNA endonuclease YhcR with UshA esterase domain
MKKIVCIAVAIFFITLTSFSQYTIPADSAKNYIGKTVTVCSTVFGTKALEKITFINLGAAHPNSPLTVVVFAKDYTNFTTAPAELYANKKLCVTGEVKEFKGKIEIVVTKPDEIKIEN